MKVFSEEAFEVIEENGRAILQAKKIRWAKTAMFCALVCVMGFGFLIGYAVSYYTSEAEAQIAGDSTYSQIKIGLSEISTGIDQNRKRLNSGYNAIVVSDNDLGAYAGRYSHIGVDIDAAIGGDPTNRSLLNFEAEWDQLVSEFQELKTNAAAQREALEAL